MSDTTRGSSTAIGRSSGGRERRRYRRFLPRGCDMVLVEEASGLFKVFFNGSKKNVALAVVDLSEGGARFITRAKLKMGSKVNVKINVRLFSDSIETLGTVCWVAEHAQRFGHYYVAVSFDKLDPVRVRKISSIREYLQSPEYKQKEETRKRQRPDYDTKLLEYDL
ncbi:MAG: PilZ domain-containing protein [Planctomycetes bacterium]|nr:PilZ domain-containing protein [Planctomycetota bacterium]